MTQYNIKVTSTVKIVWAIVITPIIIVPIIVLGGIYGPAMPEWALWTWIYALLVLAAAATLFIIKKTTSVAVLTTLDEGFIVDFAEKNFYTPVSFEIKMRQVKSFYADESSGSYYISFKTSVRPRSFNIEASSKKEEDIDSFLALIAEIESMAEKEK